jgi:cellulose synthase/poly-beta-1,6-N-acetylglucosamine synthase-like glycosyltransferase
LTVSVIVPTFRRPLELANCLGGLLEQERAPDEVVVAVRESDAASRAVLRDRALAGLPIKEVVVNAKGQVASYNAALEAARGDIVAITDDDAVPRVDWLRRIEAHFAAHGQVGAVGGRDWVHVGNHVLGGSKREVGKVKWFGGVIGNHHLGIGPPRFVDVLKGANMSFRASAITGLRFDRRLLGDGAEIHNDMAFSLAVRRSGWRILYDPEVAVDHFAASRHDPDQRGQYTPGPLRNVAHNHTLALLDHLSPGRRVVFLIWAVIVGSRAHYGIAQCIRFIPVEGKTAISKWVNVMVGRRAGWRSWNRSRAHGRDQVPAEVL